MSVKSTAARFKEDSVERKTIKTLKRCVVDVKRNKFQHVDGCGQDWWG